MCSLLTNRTPHKRHYIKRGHSGTIDWMDHLHNHNYDEYEHDCEAAHPNFAIQRQYEYVLYSRQRRLTKYYRSSSK